MRNLIIINSGRSIRYKCTIFNTGNWKNPNLLVVQYLSGVQQLSEAFSSPTETLGEDIHGEVRYIIVIQLLNNVRLPY